MQTVGMYLRGLRDIAGLTQSEAADLVGMSPKTIERWEAGRHEPKLTELQPYVRAINGSIQRVIDLLLEDVYEMTEEQKAEIDRITQTRDPEELKRLIGEIRAELDRNPEETQDVIDSMYSFWHALRARRRRR